MVKTATLMLFICVSVYAWLTNADVQFFTSFLTMIVPLAMALMLLMIMGIYAVKLKVGGLFNGLMMFILMVSLMLHHELFTLGGAALLIIPLIAFLLAVTLSLIIRTLWRHITKAPARHD